MSCRYEISDPLMLRQQQKSHYEHLYNPRATIKADLPPRKTHSVYHNNKTCHEKDRCRKIENKKMLFNLLDIYNNKPGILMKQFTVTESKPDQKRKSFYSSYKKEQQEKEIKKENKDMFCNLVKVEPSIGSHKEWSRHFQQHLENEKRLRHQNKDGFSSKDYRESFSKEKQRKLTKLEKKQEKRKETTLIAEAEEVVKKQMRNKNRRRRTEKVTQSSKLQPPLQQSEPIPTIPS